MRYFTALAASVQLKFTLPELSCCQLLGDCKVGTSGSGMTGSNARFLPVKFSPLPTVTE